MLKIQEVYKAQRRKRSKLRSAAEKKYKQLIAKNAECKCLVILHLYYQQSWQEIQEYLKNLSAYSFDLIVTVIEGNTDPAVIAEIEAFPNTKKILTCPNRGYDVAPFLLALEDVNLDAYDIVFKLQSKSTKRSWIYIYNQLFFRRDWFLNLFEGILSAENAHLTVDKLYNDPSVGMVSAENLIVSDPPHKYRLIREDGIKYGLPVPENYQFVSGTCFAVKAACLKEIQELHIDHNQFQPMSSSRGLSYAHFIERYFCMSIVNQGYRLAGNPACQRRRKLLRPLEKVLYRYSSERLHDVKEIQIDDLFFLRQLDNRLVRFYYRTIPIHKLKYHRDGRLYPFMTCPPYQYLEGNVEAYQAYCDYHEKNDMPLMSIERFEALRKSIEENGYQEKHIIMIWDRYMIADGQHRACCICHKLGKDAKIRVLQLREVGIKAFIKRILPMEVVRLISNKRKGLS